MNLHYVLFFFLSAALWDGNSGITVFQKTEGQTFVFIWHFSNNETIKFLCKRQCKDNDILIKTSETSAQNEKYGLEFKKTPTGGFLSATIKQLTKSDSGRYKLGMGEQLVPDGYGDFEIRVFGAQERIENINIHSGDEGGEITVSCLFSTSSSTKYFCKGPCREENNLLETNGDYAQSGRYILKYHHQPAINSFTIRMTIKQLTMSDSGRYRCGLGTSLQSASFQEFKISVAAAFTPPPAVTPSLSFNSESTTISSASLETTTQFTVVSCPVSFLPLVGCVIVIIGLLAVVLLLLWKVKTKAKSDNIAMKSVIYENSPVAAHEVSFYETLKPSRKDEDPTYDVPQIHSSHGAV